MKNKILLFILALLILGGAAYFGGVNLSFLGLRSAILSEDNCSLDLLNTNKVEYEKTVKNLETVKSYLNLNNCEIDGKVNNSKNTYEVSACQRRMTLRDNYATFIDGYKVCQQSTLTGPKILKGGVVNDARQNYRQLVESDDNSGDKKNESVYTLNLRGQGDSYVRQLDFQISYLLVNNDIGVTITKADLESSKTGDYVCSPSIDTTQPDATRRNVTISCRATKNESAYHITGSDINTAIKLNLYISEIVESGEANIVFTKGKFAIDTTTQEEKDITKISSVAPGTIKYTRTFVDNRDVTAEFIALEQTSSSIIPIELSFNKIIDKSSVEIDDFVISGNVTPSNFSCTNDPDANNSFHTVCHLDLTLNDPTESGNITVDFPEGSARDFTKPSPKTNAAAPQQRIAYEFQAPKIFVGYPCDALSDTCTSSRSTPQLIIKAGLGDVAKGSAISVYPSEDCTGDPVTTFTTTRDMSRVDAYDLSPFEKNESRTYSVLVGATCSSEGKTVNKKATYTFNGSTIPSVNKLSCMGGDGNIQLDKIPVSPYLANKISLCDQADKVAPTKCNAWQGNTVFNPECFPTGDGTMNNPYRICTPEQLQEIDNKDGANYILGTDINMAPADNWFGSKGFKSIGRTMYFGFRGSFRGNGFSINNLTIKDGENYSGLFAGAGAGTSGFWIDDLKMNNTTLVNPGENAGTVLGFAPCALVSGVESTQIQIRGARNTTGGMVGQSSYYPLTMIYAKASGAIETNNDINNVGNIGGVVGFSAGSLDVGFVESTVNITARASNIGGLVGYFYGNNNYLHDSITRGSITAKGGTAIGAAVGLCAGGKIENVIASPIGQNKILVEGTGVSYIGGFIGYVPGGEVILNHNSTAYKIQGSPGYQVGGFAGSINTSSALVTRNISTGWIGGTDEKGPFGQCVGGFAGSAAGQYMDNMTTSELYLDKTSAIYGAGGFAGCTGSSTFKRNYTTTHIKINNKGDWIVGGFIGILGDSPGAPFIVTDNFAMGNIIDSVGVSAGTKTTFGGFASSVYNREVNNVFQNNYHHDSRYACTSSGQAVGSNKLNCTYLNRLEPLYDVAHAAYTRSGDAWDFTNTWKAVSGGLPVLR